MISLENEKVCQNLDVKQRIFVCRPEFEKNKSELKTARCMMDPHAAAFLHPAYCPDFKRTK